jgi:transcription elongation factor GreB
VLFCCSVTAENEAGYKRGYAVVGGDEIATARGYISWTSQIGKALLGHREGDLVVVKTPGGR